MASLQKEPTGVFHIVFRYDGKRFKRSLETKTQSIALARLEEIESAIRLIQEGRILVPENVATDAFILAAGRIDAIKPPRNTKASIEVGPKGLTLKRLFEEFFGSLPDDNLESNTLNTMHTHKGHFLRLLKPNFVMGDLNGHDLQKYVNARTKERTQYERLEPGMSKAIKRKVSGTTIKKEIATLGTVWRWATSVPLVDGNFPNRGLRYPKANDKPPFQTFSEITQQIKSQNLVGSQASELWEWSSSPMERPPLLNTNTMRPNSEL